MISSYSTYATGIWQRKNGVVNASNISGDEWSKAQQTALEKALKVFTKEYEGDRWGEISKCVDGKSKKECVERYKQIVLALRESKLPK